MTKNKRHWLWNILIVLTLIFCIYAFVIHYKNWSKIEEGHFKIYSGIYRQNIPLSELDSISFVKRIPELERQNGFSWLAREKGIFTDSLTKSKVHVFVDDLRQEKIRLVHHDSIKLFVNFADSLQTQKLFEQLSAEILNATENPDEDNNRIKI